AEFAYNNSYQASIRMTPYEVLYGRPCRSPICWAKVGEKHVNTPKYIRETTEKIKIIRDRLQTAQSRQKSYYDVRHRDLNFKVGDFVYLKALPRKGVVRFGKRSKLVPRFIGPFEVIKEVGNVAYQLALPSSMSKVYDVFHVSMFRKSLRDPTHVIDLPADKYLEDGSYEEISVQILDRQQRVLRNKVIPQVKVLWRNQNLEEATWESEASMREQYPQLFEE
ncbi:hypothetical protein, partial [Modestobacter italicus]|uniref:hypothetical protein n=1 Tax=Modestobacter italicus (strain DSM 44449 / CECT 9708 / BC 501) TaxID=2732864 RepID=UPI001C93C496